MSFFCDLSRSRRLSLSWGHSAVSSLPTMSPADFLLSIYTSKKNLQQQVFPIKKLWLLPRRVAIFLPFQIPLHFSGQAKCNTFWAIFSHILHPCYSSALFSFSFSTRKVQWCETSNMADNKELECVMLYTFVNIPKFRWPCQHWYVLVFFNLPKQ